MQEEVLSSMSSPKSDQEIELTNEVVETTSDLLFGVEERPPWYLWLLLSLQQFLLSISSYITMGLVIAEALCMSDDTTAQGHFIETMMFVGGICTLLQTTFGVRLPIVQGPSSCFILPIVMLMNTEPRKCPDFKTADNSTLPFEAASEEHKALWKTNLLELQGALMLASLVEVFLGFSGLIGVLMRYIGPLTTGTTLTLIGLSLTPVASHKASDQWGICFATISLIIIFSQYLRNTTVSFFGGRKIKVFLLFPVLLGMGIAWLICFILTETDVLPDKKGVLGYESRTDTRLDALHKASWFRIPYPGQWGKPIVSARSTIAIVASILASTVESVADYHACARLCHIPSLPESSICRGIGMEGIGCLLGGAWGTGSGFTSYSQNVANIGLTKVGSRVVTQGTGVLLIIIGCLGKVGAFFSIVPAPIVGGLIYTVFAMIAADGVSSLSLIDNSARNHFVFGFSVFFVVSFPAWVAKNPFSIGNETANQVLSVFCSTSMLMGGVVAFLLDNTIPGTLKERGLEEIGNTNNTPRHTDISARNMPLIQTIINKVTFCRYIPFCPGFIKDNLKHRYTVNGDTECQDDEDEVKVNKPIVMSTD